MSESKEKNIQTGEVKKLSDMLGEVQSDLVNTRLDSLKARIEKKAIIENISTEILPHSPEDIKNFEGFEWEVAHLIAYLHAKLKVPKDNLVQLFQNGNLGVALPKNLQAVYTKASAIFTKGSGNPVYDKLFSDWPTVVEKTLIPHANTIVKMYGENSLLDMVPAQLKNLNLLSGTLLGGGLYMGWTMISKMFGESSEPFSLKSMLEFMLGGAVVGAVPAGMNLVSNYTKVKESAKDMGKESHVNSINGTSTLGTNIPGPMSSGVPSPESLGKTGTALSELTKVESDVAANKIFGTGPGADLLIALDNQYGGSGTLIKREIALGKHEGGLVFGRRNKDPASGSNIGTFQIGGAETTFADSEKKFNQCLDVGLKMYEKIFHKKIAPTILSAAHKDIICHLGYIQSQRGGESTFKKLADPSLSDASLIKLMSTTIQGGISAIGHDVVKMTKKPTIKINLA